MKFNERWLREWVDPSIPIDELAHRLTMAGLEVDSVAPAGDRLDGVVVAAVTAVEKHPQADRLSRCLVDCGAAEPVVVVCGAQNVRVGLKSPFAGPGVELPGGRHISVSEIRGVRSHGMLCSAVELSLGEDASGILELPDDASVGDRLTDYLELDDAVVDVDLTPNRGDCLCITGIAREVAVVSETTMRPIEVASGAPQIDDTFAVELEAPDACPRYAGRVIRDLDTGAPTPLWMTERLRRCGVRSINAVVDVTNYVMLELGQPMHAFDLDRLHGGIRVRHAFDGESLVMLDGQEVALSTNTLVIADHEHAVAIGGVMGGQQSAVGSDTRNVFLESAFFDPVQLVNTARRHRLYTDASHRFERGVDYTGQERGIERATRLLIDICGGRPGPVLTAHAPRHLPVRASIEFRPAQIDRLLGIDVDQARAAQIFERLELGVEVGSEVLRVTPPSFRFDLGLEADLLEEIARIYGYERIEARAPVVRTAMSGVGHETERADRARHAMVALGYYEAITYSFIEPADSSRISPTVEPRRLTNPIASDMSVMRASLWPGLLRAAKYNLNRRHLDIRLFEVGMAFEPVAGGVRQHNRIAAVALGDAVPEQWGEVRRAVDFFDLKHDLEALLAALGETSYEVSAAQHPGLRPGHSADIKINGESIGYIGALHPKLVKELDFDNVPIMFEIEIDRVPMDRAPRFRPMSKFPSVRRDISVVVGEPVPARDVLESVRRGAGELLKDLQLFDEYRGQGIDSGKKSLAMGLIFQADSSTLTEDVIEKTVVSVLEQLKHDVGGTIRE
jgi:phenylalanyl-tRNA synthetase beta chain